MTAFTYPVLCWYVSDTFLDKLLSLITTEFSSTNPFPLWHQQLKEFDTAISVQQQSWPV